MKKVFYPVILCGGSGTRLWPLSRKSLPKQFVPIFGGKSLLQLTFERLKGKKASKFFAVNGISVAKKLLCIGSLQHEHIIYDVAKKSQVEIDLILEPCQKNTAPALIATSMFLADVVKRLEERHSAIAIFCPSDHFIADVEEYLKTVVKTIEFIDKDVIITLGVQPTFPSTSYGYIVSKGDIQQKGCSAVEKFIEKPNKEKALNLIRDKNVYWNSGNFIADVDTVLKASSMLLPRTYEHVSNSLKGIKRNAFGKFVLEQTQFSKCSDVSFDKGVMEDYGRVKMLPIGSDWSDVGSWAALSKLFPEDDKGNKNVGKVHFFKSSGNFVYSTGRPVVTLGLSNAVIVESSDVVYVANLSSAEELKDTVKTLEKENVDQALNHRQVNRPWGFFDSIEKGDRFQVKKITVKSGGRLSLQRHTKRAEHWVVVKGKALVTRGTETFELKENESTFIPIGVKHRLENPFSEPVEIIEVQSGSYLGEDDIERFEDMYGRGTKNG